MPRRVGAPPSALAPSPPRRASRWSPDTSDNPCSSLIFCVPMRLTPLSYTNSYQQRDKPPSRTPLVAVPEPDRERVRKQEHRHGDDDAGRGGVLEDLLRAADPIVNLGGKRHVTVEGATGDVGLVERDPDYQDHAYGDHGCHERSPDIESHFGR